MSQYPANWRGAIQAIDELRLALLAGAGGGPDAVDNTTIYRNGSSELAVKSSGAAGQVMTSQGPGTSGAWQGIPWGSPGPLGDTAPANVNSLRLAIFPTTDRTHLSQPSIALSAYPFFRVSNPNPNNVFLHPGDGIQVALAFNVANWNRGNGDGFAINLGLPTYCPRILFSHDAANGVRGRMQIQARSNDGVPTRGLMLLENNIVVLNPNSPITAIGDFDGGFDSVYVKGGVSIAAFATTSYTTPPDGGIRMSGDLILGNTTLKGGGAAATVTMFASVPGSGTKMATIDDGGQLAWQDIPTAGYGGSVTSVSAGDFTPLFTTAVATATSTPALSFTAINQSANRVYAGPTTGSPAPADFRLLVPGDIPTLLAAKISDFDTQVRTSRLDQMAAPTAALNLNSQRITGLAAPTLGTDAATKAYVDSVGGGGGGSGTVTSFSAGNLSPLFTTAVATATSTPALSFALSNQAANLFLAGPTNGAAAPPDFRGLTYADISALVGTGANTLAAGNDTRLHTQNTDSGTTQASFQIDSGNSGPRWLNSAGTLQARNAANNAFAALSAAGITGSGPLVVTDTTAATSTTTGSGRFAGGLSVQGAVWCDALVANFVRGVAIAEIFPAGVQPATSGFAIPNSTNGRYQLDFSASSVHAATWFVAPRTAYNGGSLQITLNLSMATATSGSVSFTAAVERNANALNIASDNFATAVSGSAAVPGTTQRIFQLVVTITNANLQSLGAWEPFRIRLIRTDALTGVAQFWGASIREV